MNKEELKLVKKFLNSLPIMTKEERLTTLRILQSAFLSQTTIQLDKKRIADDLKEIIKARKEVMKGSNR